MGIECYKENSKVIKIYKQMERLLLMEIQNRRNRKIKPLETKERMA